MIPIRVQDSRPGFSPVTMGIIIINIVVFAYEVSLGPAVDGFVWQYGLIPHRFVAVFTQTPWNVQEWSTPLLTHMFLHGGWIHILGNMWFLFVFGRCLEKRTGSLSMAVFYLAGGLAAAFFQMFTNIDSTTPMIGASGAVAAVLGGFLVMGPLRPVLVLFLLLFIPIFLELPAVVVLLLWFLEQLFAGALSLTAETGQAATVAWWAHIGGFVSGFIFMRFFFRPETEDRRHPAKDEDWQRMETDPLWRYGTSRAKLFRPGGLSKKATAAKGGTGRASPPISNDEILRDMESLQEGDSIIVYDRWGRPATRYVIRKK